MNHQMGELIVSAEFENEFGFRRVAVGDDCGGGWGAGGWSKGLNDSLSRPTA